MKLDVSRVLREAGQEFPFEAVQAIAPQEIGSETVTFDDALLAGTLIALEDGRVNAEGVLTTVAHGQCAKCLEPAETPIRTEFRETFLRDGDPDDDESFSYSGSCIDLEKIAMSCAVLALPIRRLCRPDCPGIAGYTVREAGNTESQATQREHPFAALQQLLTKDEEV